jgi:UDP-N-acetylmuramoyl-tripeptide--D-alanyl-D-alanine ligase
LFVVGDEAREIGRKAIELGMDPSNVHFCSSGTEIYQILKPFLNQNSVVLLKIPHRVMVQDSFQKLKQAIMP